MRSPMSYCVQIGKSDAFFEVLETSTTKRYQARILTGRRSKMNSQPSNMLLDAGPIIKAKASITDERERNRACRKMYALGQCNCLEF